MAVNTKPIRYSRPGTQISKIFSLFLVKASDDCLCKERAKMMDIMGCHWCRDNIVYIVDWLEEEARARGMPFSRYAAERLVKIVIKRSERGKN